MATVPGGAAFWPSTKSDRKTRKPPPGAVSTSGSTPPAQNTGGESIYLYELGVFSRSLGVNGKCDCIEAHPDPDGVTIPWAVGTYRLYPIEYKHGVVRQEEEYHIQLCAQAMCLEELLGCSITAGAIFYIDSHRRNEVLLDKLLREKTLETAAAVRELLMTQRIPPAHYSAKCKKCSLFEDCRPKLKASAAKYCQELWARLEDEV